MDLREVDAAPTVRHPWETVRSDFFLGQLREMCSPLPRRVLDVGSGDAWFAARAAAILPGAAAVKCWDVAYRDPAVRDAVARRHGRVELWAEPPPGRFELITLMDVMEHVADDSAFVRRIAGEKLVAGGFLLVSVPAWPALFSAHDRALGHHRRYAPGAVRRLLRDAGVRMLRSGGLFHSLVAPRAMQVMRERLRGGAAEWHGVGRWRHGPVTTRAVLAALRLDAMASAWCARHGRDVPGLSFWAMAQRPAAPGAQR